MMSLSRRAQKIQPSPTLGISAQASKLREEGVDIADFGAGEPDFPTPEPIKKAGIEAIENNFTGYTSASGMPELKQAVVDKFKQDQDLNYTTANVTIGCGGKHVLFNLFSALVDSGDQVILPAPYWVSYPEQIRFFGGQPKIVDTTKSNFLPQPEAVREKIDDNTRVLLLNSPCNPSGAVYPPSLLKDLAELCREEGLVLISDEIYEKMIYDGDEHVSAAELVVNYQDYIVIVNGVSKAYSMTGWRIGYAAGPEGIIEKVNNLMSHSTSNPCSISQKAALKALSLDDSTITPMVKEFNQRRDNVVKRLNEIPGVDCKTPGGAFYAFPDFNELIEQKDDIRTDMELATKLLNEAHVAVVPGSPFGAPGHLRLSYATSMEVINKGLDRITDWVR